MGTIVRCKVDQDGNIGVEVAAQAMRTITKAVAILNAIAAVGGEQCKECGEAAQAVLEAVAKAEGKGFEETDSTAAEKDDENVEES